MYNDYTTTEQRMYRPVKDATWGEYAIAFAYALAGFPAICFFVFAYLLITK